MATQPQALPLLLLTLLHPLPLSPRLSPLCPPFTSSRSQHNTTQHTRTHTLSPSHTRCLPLCSHSLSLLLTSASFSAAARPLSSPSLLVLSRCLCVVCARAG